MKMTCCHLQRSEVDVENHGLKSTKFIETSGISYNRDKKYYLEFMKYGRQHREERKYREPLWKAVNRRGLRV